MTPTHWFRYVDDTWVKITFTNYINTVDPNIKFTREDAKGNQLAFLDCAVIMGSNSSFEIYRKLMHSDQYLRFDSFIIHCNTN